ncbi:MAG: hypothetical protein JXR97_10465, partial [Planctomycetes bacterium]|nr:hypothetical protein [Planctomycetota bacterium]
VIDCSKDPATDEHPYKEGGIRDSWVGRRAYATWKKGVTVKEFKGKKYREANNNEHFLYRIGRGEVKPHTGYILRVSYPDNVARYQAMHIKTGRNYEGTGFRSGTAVDDPKGNYPQTGEWQWFDNIVFNDDFTFGYKGSRAASGKHGFWVAFHDIGRCYAPEFEAGPAAGEIRLYEIPDIEKHYPVIRKPDGLPQRILMADWERMPDRVPYDLARDARFMGLNMISPVFQKWVGHAYMKTRVGFSVPEPDAWNSATKLTGEDNSEIYEKYLAATAKAGIDIAPRFEYGGSPALPKEAWVIGPDGKIDPCGRFCQWGANILHPDTWKEMETLLDDMVGSKIEKYPHIKGLLWRMRNERITCSYGKQDVEMFCKETGNTMPEGDAKKIAQWASKKMKNEYHMWWYGKRRDFLIKMRDKLKSYRPDLKLFYYNWDQDGWNLGPTPNGFNKPQDWSDYYNVDRAGEWYKRIKAEQLKLKDADYLNIVTNFGAMEWNLHPELFKDVKDIYLFAPVHWRYLADNDQYLKYFRTGSGMAMCDMFYYEEKGRWNIQNDDYQTSEMTPGGQGFSMAHQIMTLYHVDANVITFTTYTYGCGFADDHRRFAQAYLALPDIKGTVVEDAVAAENPAAKDVRVRTYESANGVYAAVVFKGMKDAEFEVSLPLAGKTTVTDLVTGAEIPAVEKDGKLVFTVKSSKMELNSYLIK